MIDQIQRIKNDISVKFGQFHRKYLNMYFYVYDRRLYYMSIVKINVSLTSDDLVVSIGQDKL